MARYSICVGDHDFEWEFPANIQVAAGERGFDVMVEFDPAIEHTARANVLALELAARLVFEVALRRVDVDFREAFAQLILVHASELSDLEEEQEEGEEPSGEDEIDKHQPSGAATGT